MEYRDKATKLATEAVKRHDAEKKIKAHLDTTFTNMGIKANEKSPAYVEAMANAKADYAQKYNRYIAMGYDSAQASHLALHAQQVTNKETGEPLPDSMGVLAEIKTSGEGSKYVITGQSVEKSLKAGHLRVAQVKMGKDEIRNDKDIIFTGTIGGDYGHRQITSIQDNITKYGVRKGLNRNKGAMQYYKGLARGTSMNWMGLVDAQLKARGHEGLWPGERPPEVDLLEGRNSEGVPLDDPYGLQPLANEANRAFNYADPNAYVYGMAFLNDGATYGKNLTSYWDNESNLISWTN
jgi:hypothetical protein